MVGSGSFVDRVRRSRDQLAVPVRILVWGPGRTAPKHWYEKRMKVVGALKSASPNFLVTTSEDIFDQDPPDDSEAGQLELLHAKEAHLILALVLGPPHKQGGVYRELDLISWDLSLRDKTWIFLPRQKSYEKRFQGGALQNFRESHLIAYPWKIIKDCDRIRRFCIEKAEEEFRQLRLEQLHAMVRSH